MNYLAIHCEVVHLKMPKSITVKGGVSMSENHILLYLSIILLATGFALMSGEVIYRFGEGRGEKLTKLSVVIFAMSIICIVGGTVSWKLYHPL